MKEVEFKGRLLGTEKDVSGPLSIIPNAVAKRRQYMIAGREVYPWTIVATEKDAQLAAMTAERDKYKRILRHAAEKHIRQLAEWYTAPVENIDELVELWMEQAEKADAEVAK